MRVDRFVIGVPAGGSEGDVLTKITGADYDAAFTLGSQFIRVLAGENISGGKAVMVKEDGKAYVFDISNEGNYGLVCGIAKQGVILGDQLDIFIMGIATEAGSGWVAGKRYYISSTGSLSITPPSPPCINRMIGVGVANDKILINTNNDLITI